MSNIQIFNFKENQVRTILINGEPYFVGNDVAKALGYVKPRNAIEMHCRGALKQGIPSSSGEQEYSIIPERDVYRLVMRSSLPEAERFQDWVFEEVLPAIRKTGSYSIQLPQTFSEALQLAADQAKKIEEQGTLLLEAKPKTDFYDAVTGSEDTLDIGAVSKILNFPGYGPHILFEFLRNEGILMKDNQAYQVYIDQGYFRTIESQYTKPDGSSHINKKTVAFQRGLDFIRKRIEKHIANGGVPPKTRD